MSISYTMRSTVAWGVKYGIAGFGLRSQARRGELIARIAADPGLRDDPFPAYDELRAMGPLVAGRYVLGTASYSTANEVLRGDTFLACPASSPFPRLNRLLERISDPDKSGPVDPPSLLAINGMDHTRMRKLAGHAFTPRNITRLSARIHDLAHGMLDELIASGTGSFDLIESFASRLPVTVIAEILGVPDSTRREFVGWVNDGALSLEPTLTLRQYRQADAAIQMSHVWLTQHIASLRANPQDNLLSKMIEAVDGSDRLTDTELRATALLILGAGFETTVNLIGNATALLLRHPDQLARLRAEPDGWPNAVEEVLRYDSPVQVTVRIAKADTEAGGRPVKKGELVVIMIGGANRDPEHFEDPSVFDTTRANARDHLALSAGAHYCLGAHLARLEGATALQALFERLPDLALDATRAPIRRGTRVLRGYKLLPLTASRSATHPTAAHTRGDVQSLSA